MNILYKCSVFLFLCLFITGPRPVCAEDTIASFIRMDRKNGFPATTVFQIMQDQKGFIWFGTRDGLIRYDGFGYKVFKNIPFNPQSLSHSDAGGVVEAPDGNLWVRTWGGGVNRLDPETETVTRYLHNPEDSGSISENRVQSLFVDSKGRIWAGTFSKGLNRLDTPDGKFYHYRHDPTDTTSLSHDRIWSITEDDAGQIWIGTDAGLNQLNPETGIIKRWFQDAASAPFFAKRIRSLARSRSGSIWMGTESGLYRFNTGSETLVHHPYGNRTDGFGDAVINALLPAGRHLWIGTQSGGLTRYDPITGERLHFLHDRYNPESISHNDIRALFLDRTRTLWIGTRGGGANRYDTMAAGFRYHRNDPENPWSLSGDTVPAVLKDHKGRLWAGTWYAGLNRLDPGSKKFRQFLPDPDVPGAIGSIDINTLFQDTRKRIWIGTWGAGLALYQPKTGTFRHYRAVPGNLHALQDDVILSIANAPDGDLWVGTRNGGLHRFHPETGRFDHFRHDPEDTTTLSNNAVVALHTGKDGALWIATEEGLNRMDPETGAMTRFLHDPEKRDSLSHDQVTSLLTDRKGQLWIGTYGGGLNRLDGFSQSLPRPRFQHITEAEGLTDNIVRSLTLDAAGRIWVATNNGITRLEPDSGSLHRYDTGDSYNTGSATISHDGEISLGGQNGITRFRPDCIRDNPYPPHVVITRLEVFDRPLTPKSGDPENNGTDAPRSVSFQNPVVLSHTDHMITIGFAALHFAAPDKNRYRYRLLGFNSDWIGPTPEKDATYTNLAPGSYTFQVSAKNPDGVWSPAPTELQFVITPPFWSTWYFKTAATFSLLFLLAAGYALRIGHMKRRNRELERIVAERTEDLRRQRDEMEQLARTDSLTRLPNRRAMREMLDQEAIRTQRYYHPFVIAIADIDHFKQINDTHGHDCGDMVLKETARLLAACLRQADVVARWGGEEFLILLRETDLNGAATALEKLRQTIEENTLWWQETPIRITITAGAVVYHPDIPIDDSLRAADKALYEGKRTGRNRILYKEDESI